jgi:TnsA endonuclease N terminal/TnsA endonuclease C terminal
MAKRRYEIDETKIARFHKEGRGTGVGKDYKPWLTVQDVSSLGRSSRIYSFKTGREHHFFSDLETGLFHLLNWSDAVVDIREQFPLDRKVTRMLAQQMGIVHPRDTNTQTDIVMTTDFVLDVVTLEKKRFTKALSVKPENKLVDMRTLEKQELERRCWRREKTDWGIVTDRDLPVTRIANLRWLHELYSLDGLKVAHADYWPDRCERFLGELSRARGGLIQDFTKYLEVSCGFAPGDAMTVLRHLAATKKISINLDKPFSARDAVTTLVLVGPSSARRTA